MKYRFFHQCAPRRKNSPYECEDIVIEREQQELPFFPAIGMHLQLTPAMGDYGKVELIFWNAEEPGVLDIYFEEPRHLAPWKAMMADGWKEAKSDPR